MNLFIASASACFLLFVASRAIRVPFTYDEAASYIRYIDSRVPSVFDTNVLSIFNFEVATNHFLNSALTKLCYLVGGSSEFALRLPNLVGYVLYLAFAATMLRRASSRPIAAGGFLLLNLNPYVLDFFALSRGYGLSLGLLMGSVFFLMRFVDRTRTTSHRRDLAYALSFAVAAVMANFALLNVYLSIIAIVLIAAVFNKQPENLQPILTDDHSDTPRRSYLVWFIGATVFITLVFSQDARLSDALYEPVVIGLNGLDDGVLDQATVTRLDIHGRESPLFKEPAVREWTLRGRSHVRGLRITLPRIHADAVSRIDVNIGARPFVSNPYNSVMWTRQEVGEMRVFESTAALSLGKSHVAAFASAINWTGDRVYVARLIGATGAALAVLIVCAVLLHALGSVVTRADLLRIGEWRVLSFSLLWAAALAGPPLYLLKRNSELYFGGTRGLVADTFSSVIESSFYGDVYRRDQVTIVLGLIVFFIFIFSIVLVRASRERGLSTFAPALCLIGIVSITSCALVVQRFALNTVYLTGRTALFFYPLFVLFFCFACDGLAQAGRIGRAVAVVLMSVTAAVGAAHFARTANMKFVFDWKDDASTKQMIEDVQQFVAPGLSSRVALGVAPPYAPVAVYYTRRAGAPIDVTVVPAPHNVSFLYDLERNVPAGGVVSRYPLTRTALARIP